MPHTDLNNAASAGHPALEQVLADITQDFKASVVAAEIAANGIPAETFFFRNRSTFERPYSNDVERIYWSDGEEADRRLIFELNREGIYDMLPEAIVHGQAGRKSRDAVRLGNELRREEREARAFFSPLENEFHSRSLRLDTIERELLKNDNPQRAREFFHYFYEDSSALTDNQLLTLLYILPLSHKIRNNFELIGITLTRILGYPVHVKSRWVAQRHEADEETLPVLGAGSLGRDTILGMACTVPARQYEVMVENIPADDYRHFMGKGRHRNVLDFILPYLFAASAVYEVVLHSAPEEAAFCLSHNTASAFLGFNSYI